MKCKKKVLSLFLSVVMMVVCFWLFLDGILSFPTSSHYRHIGICIQLYAGGVLFLATLLSIAKQHDPEICIKVDEIKIFTNGPNIRVKVKRVDNDCKCHRCLSHKACYEAIYICNINGKELAREPFCSCVECHYDIQKYITDTKLKVIDEEILID